ncbi:LuxR C-terminal-related transcriptional regulator [Flavihumibacter sp. ZG627]|uniref:LuxR C-terminal-related transcriptional regulator n=1 Tax=Flavihumibacter sp. ZG627 TaxID=1463156 RepID=UPI000693E32C|nr:LuxR C-terminal-related transcriptional regulator [Flavihumibacter sp. ZG627]
MIESIKLSVNAIKEGQDHSDPCFTQHELNLNEQLLLIRNILDILESIRKERSGYALEVTVQAYPVRIEQDSTPNNQVHPGFSSLLSKREIEVLNLMFDGLTNKEIANRLFISLETVKSHRKHILEKTGSRNTAAIMKFFKTQTS